MVSAFGILKSGLRKCFYRFLHESKELVRDRAIDYAMVERDRKVRAGANGDGVFPVSAGQNFWPLLDSANAENGNLRLVDDRRAHQRSKDSRIGDGEGSFLYFLRRQLLGASARRQIVQCARDSRKREIVGALDHGNDQSPIQRHGDTNVDLLSVDD